MDKIYYIDADGYSGRLLEVLEDGIDEGNRFFLFERMGKVGKSGTKGRKHKGRLFVEWRTYKSHDNGHYAESVFLLEPTTLKRWEEMTK